MKPLFIAEVKTHSPFGWQSSQSWDELFECANRFGDWISIHTDPRWGGSFDLIKKARQLTKKPILAKGIHRTDEEIKNALDCGANFVLVVGRTPQIDIDKCLIEPLSLNEIPTYPTDTRLVWNSRNLLDGGLKIETFSQARALHSGWLCQASNIKTPTDVSASADAILVGTHLSTFVTHLT